MKKTSSLPSSLKEKTAKKAAQTDAEMLKKVARHFLVFVVIILMFDTLLDIFLGLIDFLLNFVHLLLEIIEYSIELLLESLFHTSHQQSEMIIVNGVLILCLYTAYRFFHLIPQWSIHLKNCISQGITNKFSDWQSMPFLYKIKLLSAYSGGCAFLSFFMI